MTMLRSKASIDLTKVVKPLRQKLLNTEETEDDIRKQKDPAQRLA